MSALGHKPTSPFIFITQVLCELLHREIDTRRFDFEIVLRAQPFCDLLRFHKNGNIHDAPGRCSGVPSGDGVRGDGDQIYVAIMFNSFVASASGRSWIKQPIKQNGTGVTPRTASGSRR